MDLSWRNIFASGHELHDNDIRDVTISWHNGSAYLFGTTGYHGGLFSYQLSGSGAVLIDTAYFDAARGTAATGTVEVYSQDGQEYLLYGTWENGDLARIHVQDNGGLGNFGVHDGFEGFGAGAIVEAVPLGGGEIGLYTIDAATGSLWAHDLNTTQSRSIELDLGAGAPLVHTRSQDDVFIVVGDTKSGEVISYRVGANPEDLVETARLGASDGLSIGAPTVLAAITAYGSNWIVVGGADNNALAVVKQSASGFLHTTDLVMDTQATRFADVSTLELITVNGQVLVFAAGSDDGLSVFSLLPDGQLVLRDTLVHDIGLGLENVQDIEAIQIGDTLHVYVASTTSDGLAWLTVDVGDMTAPVTAAVGARTVTGTVGDDIILGSDTGADTLFGGAGDDLLVSAAAGGDLTGGTGADIFVIGQAGTTIRVTDFELGVDRLDLSSLPFLYDPASIDFARSGQDVILTHRDTIIGLSFASVPAGGVEIEDIFPSGTFADADRVQILSFAPGLFAEGGNGDDTLTGGVFADTLMGGGGSDQARGGDGDDTIIGEQGDDSLSGELGNDSLMGGDGVDTLQGDDGDDTLMGGDGNDSLDGGLGNDILDGQSGNDAIVAGRGDDTIYGGSGDDDIRSDGGNDIIYGGPGVDFLRGGREEDTIYGEEDNDIIRGQKNADTIYGGAGDDNIKGGGGNDWLAGGDGADFIKGGTRSDMMLGGQGDDRIFANSFDDTLDGGRGDDFLNGGGGDDRLIGGRGNDTVKGGSGADTFVFASNMGQDQVLDFTSGEDVLEFNSNLLNGVSTAAQVVSRFGEIDNGTAVFDFDSGQVITLNGVTSLGGLADDILIV